MPAPLNNSLIGRSVAGNTTLNSTGVRKSSFDEDRDILPRETRAPASSDDLLGVNLPGEWAHSPIGTDGFAGPVDPSEEHLKAVGDQAATALAGGSPTIPWPTYEERLAEAKAAKAKRLREYEAQLAGGDTNIDENGDLRQPKETLYDVFKTNSTEFWDIVYGARASGMSDAESDAVKDSLHAFNVGTATAADIDRIMRLQSDTVYMESTTMFRGSGTNRREIAGRDRYFSGGRDMKAALDNIVTRTMSTAMEGLPQDLASQKFTSTEEMSRYIEQKTGLPADAVREQLKRDELAAFAKETGKASFSPKDAEGRYADYPVLATIASEARKDQIAADLEKYEAKGNIDVALLDKKKNMLFSNAGGDPENRLLYEALYHEDYMRTRKYDRDRIAKMNSNIESGAISGKQADGTVASIPREDPLSEAKGNGMARVAKSKAAGIISGVGKSGSGKSGRELRNEAYKALAAGLDGFTREQIVSNFRVDVETMVRSTGEANAEANMSVLKGEVKGGLIKIAKSDFDGTQKAKRIYLSAGTAAMQFDDFVKQYGTEKGYSNGLIRQLQESGGTNEGDVATLRGELSAAHNKAREEVVDDMADDINYNEEAGAKHYRQANWAVGGKVEPMEKYVAGAWNANPSTAATKKIIPILSMDPVRREKTSRDMERFARMAKDKDVPKKVKDDLAESARESTESIIMELPGGRPKQQDAIDGDAFSEKMKPLKRDKLEDAFDDFPEKVRENLHYTNEKFTKSFGLGTEAPAGIFTPKTAKKISDDYNAIRSSMTTKATGLYTDGGKLKQEGEVVEALFGILENYGIFGIQTVGTPGQWIAGKTKVDSLEIITRIVYGETSEALAIKHSLNNGYGVDGTRFLNSAIAGIFSSSVINIESTAENVVYALSVGPADAVNGARTRGHEGPEILSTFDSVINSVDEASEVAIQGTAERDMDTLYEGYRNVATSVRASYSILNRNGNIKMADDLKAIYYPMYESARASLVVARNNLENAQAQIPGWIDKSIEDTEVLLKTMNPMFGVEVTKARGAYYNYMYEVSQ